MKNFNTYYRRNLPHYQPLGYTYFVTYRLSGSLPLEVIKKLKGEREKQLKEIAGISDKSIQQEKYKKCNQFISENLINCWMLQTMD